MKAQSHAPAVDLSVILFTPYPSEILHPILCAMQAQTARDRMELVVAVRSREVFGATEADLATFGAVRIVEVGESALISEAKVAAVRAASAPVVAFAEDHCFPESDWAEMLIAAHRGELSGVGPSVRNPNPRTGLSTAAYYMHWGPWIEPVTNPPLAGIAPHNGSYRRSALLELGDRLPGLLLAEQFLQASLIKAGHQIGVEPRAVISHTNVSRLSPWIGHDYWGGRLFGAMRAQHENWSPLKRTLRVFAAPAIPAVRLRRTIKDIIRSGRGRELLPQIIPTVLFGLIIHAIGEAIGYAAGPGAAVLRYNDYEVSRLSHLANGELAEIKARWSGARPREQFA